MPLTTSKLSGSYNGFNWGPGNTAHCAGMEGFYDLPDVFSNDVPKALGAGWFAGTDRAGGLTVTLTLVLIGTGADASAAVDAFDAAVDSLRTATAVQATDKQLRFWNSTRYINCRPRRRRIDIDATKFQNAGIAEIQFFAADPTIYTV